MNHTSRPQDVTDVLRWFAEASRPSEAGRRRVTHEDRNADVRGGWAQSSDFGEAEVRDLPLQ
jgi:hypothetical protein